MPFSDRTWSCCNAPVRTVSQTPPLHTCRSADVGHDTRAPSPQATHRKVTQRRPSWEHATSSSAAAVMSVRPAHLGSHASPGYVIRVLSHWCISPRHRHLASSWNSFLHLMSPSTRRDSMSRLAVRAATAPAAAGTAHVGAAAGAAFSAHANTYVEVSSQRTTHTVRLL